MAGISGRGAPLPDASKSHRYPIVIVPPDRAMEVVIVSESWLGMRCHWGIGAPGTSPRSWLCTAPESCICLSEVDVPIKWHSYLSVVTVHNMRPAILSLTTDGINSILDASEHCKTLRGLVMVLKRAGKHKSARVIAEPSERRFLRQLPERWCHFPTLEAVYGKPAMDAWRGLYPQEDGTP